MSDETRGTVVVALAANVAVAVAKLAAGLLTGSAAMLSEAAHSFADTPNEVFLLVSLRRSARPADRTHPFGYGKERFFYSLLAAVGIFVSGAGFAAYQGVEAIVGSGREPEPSTIEFAAIYAVLAVSLVLEGASLRKALRQVAGEARAAGRSFLKFVVRSPDPTVKTVAGEDTVAVVGVVVAFAGTLLHQLTGSPVWDGVASLIIAALLGYIAVVLGRDTKELLIGEAADPVVRATAYAVISSYREIVAVKDILTMQLGPSAVLLAARVQFDDEFARWRSNWSRLTSKTRCASGYRTSCRCSSTRPRSPPRTWSRSANTSVTTSPTSPPSTAPTESPHWTYLAAPVPAAGSGPAHAPADPSIGS